MFTKGAFEKAKNYFESHHKFSEDKKLYWGPCITISRQTGAGADKVSESLVKFFDGYKKENSPQWTVFDKNLIEKVLQDYNLPHRLAQVMEEKKYSAIISMANELLGGQPGIWDLIHKTTRTILQLAQTGNVIIIGRGGNIITARLKNSFHVRLVAAMEDRIKHVQEFYQLDRTKSIEFIKKDDASRRNYLMTYFNKNIDDPLLYHLTINTTILPYEDAAQLIGLQVLQKFPEMFSKPEVFHAGMESI
ncbi:MAG TPA: cytidylate kinase-like family protein [Ignavibacteriaceae bacterium]|nr:cytidylate kinase-like family protein [Ignavibacteriaceae bacterium]